jgi:hypothetical protein
MALKRGCWKQKILLDWQRKLLDERSVSAIKFPVLFNGGDYICNLDFSNHNKIRIDCQFFRIYTLMKLPGIIIVKAICNIFLKMVKYSKNIMLGLTLLSGLLLNAGCDKLVSQDVGFLEGKISIGPICPVETVPPDPGCLPTAETYKSYPVSVWTPDGRNKITLLKPSLDGSYKTDLCQGNYLIILETGRGNIGSSSLPVEVTIISGNVTTLNIDIDTGIR